VPSLVGGQIHKGLPLATVNSPRQPQFDRLVQSAVRIRMVGANPHPKMTALASLSGRVNYLIGMAREVSSRCADIRVCVDE